MSWNRSVDAVAKLCSGPTRSGDADASGTQRRSGSRDERCAHRGADAACAGDAVGVADVEAVEHGIGACSHRCRRGRAEHGEPSRVAVRVAGAAQYVVGQRGVSSCPDRTEVERGVEGLGECRRWRSAGRGCTPGNQLRRPGRSVPTATPWRRPRRRRIRAWQTRWAPGRWSRTNRPARTPRSGAGEPMRAAWSRRQERGEPGRRRAASRASSR